MSPVILRVLPLSGSRVVPVGEGDEVNGCFRSGGGSGFGKGFGVFSFSRLTGAAYLLGVVLMHCVLVYSGQGGTVGAASAASETDHLECRRLALRECKRETLTPRGGDEDKMAGVGGGNGNQWKSKHPSRHELYFIT